MPLRRARARKPAASASDTRFEIVMVMRSLAAAKAIRAGNNRRRAMSRIIGLHSPWWSEHRQSLAVRDEQSENGQAVQQILAIREARTKSASASATQTTSTGASP